MIFGCFTYCLVMFNIYPVTCFVLEGLTRETKKNIETTLKMELHLTLEIIEVKEKKKTTTTEMILTAIETTEGFEWGVHFHLIVLLPVLIYCLNVALIMYILMRTLLSTMLLPQKKTKIE